MVTTYEMQSIPSLIGAGTAVAAAATGLAFGQLPGVEQQESSHNDPDSTRKTFESDRELTDTDSLSGAGTNSAASRASAPSPAQPLAQDQNVPSLLQSTAPVHATSQARASRRASHVRTMSAQKLSFRQSLSKQGENTPQTPAAEDSRDSRDSVSSSSSWIRRWSFRPLSQHGSLRSSSGPDSPSLFSFGSGVPIFSSLRDTSQLPPNKLVKRTAGTNSEDDGLSKKRRSRTQMTLRKPATSHQRAATLQHQIAQKDLPSPPNPPGGHQKRTRASTVGAQEKPILSLVKEERSRWKSFWHARLSYSHTRTTTTRGDDGTGQPSGRRIRLEQQTLQQVYLVTPNKLMMDGSPSPSNWARGSNFRSSTNSPRSSEDEADSTNITPSERRKRPLSIQLSSTANWIARAGSLRRSKRANETVESDERRFSAPIEEDAVLILRDLSMDPESIREGAEPSRAEADLAAIFRPPGATRAPPSPLPPLSRLSSFHADENCLGSSPSVPTDRPDEDMASPAVSSRVNSQTYHPRTLERASTVGSSEYQRGFTSGDDDDTDFKTDTPFDSFRTVASGRKPGLESPLETLFDDSPPGTSGNNSKPKRLSIQEILGPSFDGGNKIMEEDESISILERGSYAEFEAGFGAKSLKDQNQSVQSFIPQDILVDENCIRLSLDDDDDDDLGWAREDEVEIYNALSPPGSMNHGRGNPNLRTRVVLTNGNDKHDVYSDPTNEQPRSTVFDWTEPTVHDKLGKNGIAYRPKTVHGKQEIDMRGGRSASRKGPVAAHVRSQSVPLVPDPAETAKSTPKFGTWGIGQKNVSEHWDDDFEFEEDTGPMSGSMTGLAKNNKENRSSMFVPASIQATQPTVKAHSGQIRELSLLVNDLKRLCRLGREMGMLAGSSTKLWYEAEGIIALASPDEDADATGSGTADDFDSASFDEHFTAQGFDGASLGVQKSLRHLDSPSHCQSIFSPDDVFGTTDNTEDGGLGVDRPATPEKTAVALHSASVARSVMESMRKRIAAADADEDREIDKPSGGKLNFDTNSLKELVKRAGDLRDSLSELVRREDPIIQSPGRSPKHTRADGSPAFTRVFDEPTSSSTRNSPHSRKVVLGGKTVGTSASDRMDGRMQVLTVS
ncbi:hypothetical protein GGS21DRAFT_544161 [Xylaria nigripes]|nr:hypothetical protein GGS21DRAFT_544161 [Xylaria nigripes]